MACSPFNFHLSLILQKLRPFVCNTMFYAKQLQFDYPP